MRLPQTPSDYQPVIMDLIQSKFNLLTQCGAPTLPDGRYLHWDELRHREPPAGRTDFTNLVRRGYFEPRRISGKGKRFYPDESLTKKPEHK